MRHLVFDKAITPVRATLAHLADAAHMDDLLNAAQWPAMAVTLAAAWLVGSRSTRKRGLGFLCYGVGNVLWVVWGWHTQAYALIALQVGLFALNLRGAKKAETDG